MNTLHGPWPFLDDIQKAKAHDSFKILAQCPVPGCTYSALKKET